MERSRLKNQISKCKLLFQRIVGKIYLLLGMTKKASHMLGSEHTKDTYEMLGKGYDHDKITQDDLALIENLSGSTETPSFVYSIKDIEAPSPIRKTLTLKKSLVSSSSSVIETNFLSSNRSEQKKIVVKYLKTRKAPIVTVAEHGNPSLFDTKPSIVDTPLENKIATLSQETSKSLGSSFVAMSEDSFRSVVIDEHQDAFERSVSFPHTMLETETISSGLNATNTSAQSMKIDELNLQTEFDPVHLSHIFIIEDENNFYDSELNLGSRPDNDELALGLEPVGLIYHQNDNSLPSFTEEESEFFDVSDDVFLSEFDIFEFDEDFDEEELFIDEPNDGEQLKLTRWERAQQVAIDVIYLTNSSDKHLDFLTDVFFENGWGMARKTIEREIRSGTSFDELILAWDFKEIWKNCDRYWIAFNKIGPTAHVTEAIYRSMSWVQALRIIRCFNWLPSIEELEVFLDDEFEYWYQHTLMRALYPSFMKYLCYHRAQNTSYMDFELGPYDLLQHDDPMDKGDFINCNSEYRQRLYKMGLDSVAAFMP